MKTVQNKMWMRFLMFGAFSLLFFGLSCAKIEREQFAEFIYINATDHKISFVTPTGNSFNLLSLEKHQINQNQPAQKTIGFETYSTPFVTSNSIVLKFDGDKCLTMTNSSENSILNIAHYSAVKIDEKTYRLTYTFTAADYNRAVNCP